MKTTKNNLIKFFSAKNPFKSKHFHLLWFNPFWWKYLLEKPADNSSCNWWERFWCRASNHPDGVWWYSNKIEPDMRCKRCGDDLG